MKSFRILSIALIVTFLGCKKDDPLNYSIQGKIVNARTGAPILGVIVKMQQQVIENGIFTGLYTDAAQTTTDGAGNFLMTWTRENIAAFRLALDKDLYIPRDIDISTSSLGANDVFTYNAQLFPEAFISVHIKNELPANLIDQFNFRFDDTHFDCNCCNDDWKYFSGDNIDSTFTCRIYGDSWIQYERDIQTFEQDTTILDSLFCPSFITSELELNY